MGKVLGNDTRSRLVFLWDVVIGRRCSGRRGRARLSRYLVDVRRARYMDLRFAELSVVKE